MKELEELERLANKATPGPWHDLSSATVARIGLLGHGYNYIARFYMWSHRGSRSARDNASYVASASPDVILSLIRELKITRAALYKCCFDLSMDSGLLLKRYERELYPETEQPK